MLSGATPRAWAMAGTAVLRTVVSSDSMKNATATSHGNNRFADAPGAAGGAECTLELSEIILVTEGPTDSGGFLPEGKPSSTPEKHSARRNPASPITGGKPAVVPCGAAGRGDFGGGMDGQFRALDVALIVEGFGARLLDDHALGCCSPQTDKIG